MNRCDNSTSPLSHTDRAYIWDIPRIARRYLAPASLLYVSLGLLRALDCTEVALYINMGGYGGASVAPRSLTQPPMHNEVFLSRFQLVAVLLIYELKDA